MYYLEWVNLDLYDSDLSNRLTGGYNAGANPSSPKTNTISLNLSKGTYYIKVSKYNSSYTVKYKLSWNINVNVSKLKAKKKYYVRVRAYKTVNGTKYYGAWSKTKTVKTK